MDRGDKVNFWLGMGVIVFFVAWVIGMVSMFVMACAA